jgi:ribosomal protein S8
MAKPLTPAALTALHNVARYTVSGHGYPRAQMDQRVVRRLEREGYIVTANELSRCTRKGLEAAPQHIAESVIAHRAA